MLNSSVLGATGITPQGAEAVETLLSAGLQIPDPQGVIHPILAEDVPTTDNGGWVLLPDGRMQITWKIRPNAEWHDGTPFTANDLKFTYTLTQDRELTAWRTGQAQTYDPIESIEIPDPKTIVTYWKRPYIYANLAFGFSSARPLFPVPQHILEKTYLTDKSALLDLPFWSTEFVGAGPYKLKEFQIGSKVIVTANDRFVLGRPKIDEIEVRFIPDPATMVANFLAGEVNLNMGVSMSPEQARQILERVPGSKMDLAPTGVLTAFPQFFNADPPQMTNLSFRRALLHALDRQEMADALMFGLSTVGHTFINPVESDYKDIEASITRYDYDARRSAQLLEGMGLAKGSDGMYREASGQLLTPVEIRTEGSGGDLRQKAALSLADYWKRVGVPAAVSVTPQQRDGDQEYLANYPGVEITRRGNFRWSLGRVFFSNESPMAENRWAGGNRGRYQNADLDRLIERHDVAIPLTERTRLLGEIIRTVTDDVVLMGLFYDLDPTVSTGNLMNVTGKYERSTQAWNAYQWDLR
ncbi:MAG: hypothetical protein HW416_2656 [Chloroflexi bacterium]|nr:hypothetical protein [Chloroflexota bacterium]